MCIRDSSAISLWTIRKELQLGTLLARKLSHTPMRRTFRAIHPEGRTPIPSAEALLALLQTQALSPLPAVATELTAAL